MIIHAGDFVADTVLSELEQLAPVAAVHGNMDDQALCERLPETRVVEVGGSSVGIVHDPGPRLGRGPRLTERFPRCGAVVYGHTHEPQVSRLAAAWILNPGSPTERRRAPFRSMVVLREHEGRLTPELLPLA